MLNKRVLFWSILLFVMWLIFSNNLQIANVFIGLGVSFGVALLYTKLFPTEKFDSINPYWLGVYVLVLIKQLIISNLRIMKRVLSKDMKLSPAIVGVKTELTSDWKKLLLANSVTLTPGTLTLEVKGNMLYIHVIEFREDSDKDAITKEFESVIAKI